MICDRRFQNIEFDNRVIFIASGSPYRKLESNDFLNIGMIKANKTFSSLVYDVKMIPDKAFEYVWNFGSLNTKSFEEYTKIMIAPLKITDSEVFLKLISFAYSFFTKKEGFEILGRSEEMAVVGVSEIVAQYSKLKAVFDKLVEEAARRRPKVVVVMDYPEFNLMLSKKLHG